MRVTSLRGAALVELLRGGRTVQLTAHGGSMRPAIDHGDALTISPCAPEQAQVGDVVLFAHGGELVTHRLVGKAPLRARGDGSSETEMLENNAILGRVVKIQRRPRGLRRRLGHQLERRPFLVPLVRWLRYNDQLRWWSRP